MIETTVDTLQKGDRIRFSGSAKVYTLERHPQIHSFEHVLRHLWFEGEGPGTVTVPADATVTAVSMMRMVDVPCLVHGDTLRMPYDLASGAAPLGVICGECDERTTARVRARMAEERIEDVTGEEPFAAE